MKIVSLTVEGHASLVHSGGTNGSSNAGAQMRVNRSIRFPRIHSRNPSSPAAAAVATIPMMTRRRLSRIIVFDVMNGSSHWPNSSCTNNATAAPTVQRMVSERRRAAMCVSRER